MPIDVNGVNVPTLAWQQRVDEMVAHFERRTYRHIDLVQKYCRRLADALSDIMAGQLICRMEVHDQSKLREPEREPYIWVTWQYRCRDLGVPFDPPPGMEGRMRAATELHVRVNPHHPEHWDPDVRIRAACINLQDRDAPPAKIVDATRMLDLYLYEMVADWCAVSEERGGSPVEWADANVGVRWAFTDAQRKVIYDAIAVAWHGVTR
jgi:hypothetical protein